MIVGIDPGIRGAAAALNGDSFVDVIDLPTIQVGKRAEIDTTKFYRWLNKVRPRKIVIEHVHSMPREGAVGAFRFGVAVGMLRALSQVTVHEVEMVEPHVWKRYFDLLHADKDESRQLAIVLWPEHAGELKRMMDHQRAEAMLIARWGLRPPIGRDW